MQTNSVPSKQLIKQDLYDEDSGIFSLLLYELNIQKSKVKCNTISLVAL